MQDRSHTIRWPYKTGHIVGLLAILVVNLVGCMAANKKAYLPDEIRQKLVSGQNDIDEHQLVVPFEVDEKYVKMARKLVRRIHTQSGKAKELVDLLFSGSHYGLEYDDLKNLSATETLRAKRGNCLSLANAFIGLARSFGLEAYYMDVSERFEDEQKSDQFTIRTGHITAVVNTEIGWRAIDVGYRNRHMNRMRIMDDLEATAHFYNNRGYEILQRAQSDHTQPDWESVIQHFQLATRIFPRFYRAWNNLGVVYNKLGRSTQAEQCYRNAIAVKPYFFSSHFNLGLLFLSQKKFTQAASAMQTAANIEPNNTAVHHLHGMALLQAGSLHKASLAFEKAVELDKSHFKAQNFLKKINLYRGRLERFQQ